MKANPSRLARRSSVLGVVLALATILIVPTLAQDRGSPEGEWRYQSGDAWGTRYSPLGQINRDNFEDLEVAWVWRGDNFSPHPFYPVSVDSELHRWSPLHRCGLSAHDRRDRPLHG